MPNIKPISDLRNYTKVLDEVAIGSPVYLTKNGRGKYAVLDIAEYEKQQATIQLLSALAQGERAAQQSGWRELDDIEAELGISNG
ncbi:MAG: type II toxin-antitoxin system Phd/YefM family antitoxin [Clostridiales bacterium]|nr:type II toxin-antitoxin system Phd/YefM family antitoxin [Clostridiales bacterium]